MKQLTILGSTGSIGTSTLSVVRHNPDKFSVTALVAGKNVARMAEQCLEFKPRWAVMDDEISASELRRLLKEQGSATEVLAGQQAACEMAALDEVNQVMAAIVGAAGLLPTLAAIAAGKQVLLANKESLVTCGRLFMDAVQRAKPSCCLSTANTTPFFRVYRKQSSKTSGTLNLRVMAFRRLFLPDQVARSVRRIG